MDLMLLTTHDHGDPDASYELFDAAGEAAVDDQFCQYGEVRDDIEPAMLGGKPARFGNVRDLIAAVQKYGINITREYNVWIYEGD